MFAKELFALLVVLGFVFSAPASPITVCTDITSPGGTYVLTANLSGNYDATTYCLGIHADNVTVDCNKNIISDAKEYDVHIQGNNVTLKNCELKASQYGVYAVGYANNILNNTFVKNEFNGILVQSVSYGTIISGNLARGTKSGNCIQVESSLTKIADNIAGNCGGDGFYIAGKEISFERNIAYNCAGSGVYIKGEGNNITDNTAAENDWEEYSGGGFEIYGVYNRISGNTAFNNTNGFYLEGLLPPTSLEASPQYFGNTFTDNHAYNNLVGLNVIDYNGTYTDNLLEENLEADFLVGGDMWIGGSFLRGGLRTSSSEINPEAMCDNIFANTGSGGRPIYFTNKTVTLTSGTYSEAIVCDADNSKLSGLAISGSDTLDNNGMLLFFTEDAEIKSSNSKNNFLGFGFVMSDGNSLEGSNSDGSGLGIAATYSRDLSISDHSSANNRMESTLLFDLFQMFLEGAPLTGEPMRAAERPDIGAGALFLLSPRATLTDVSFSESTMGALFIMSDESTISGGGAFNNDLLGYGFIESYNGTISGAGIYGNDGNIYDILGEEIPEQYEILEFLPLGAGVFDFSISTLEGLPIIGGEMQGSVEGCMAYSYCEMDMGMICDFDSGACVEGTFENKYVNSRVYENNYGLILLSRGHEFVEGCRIYDNNVLGIMDASNTDTGLVGRLGTSSIPAESTRAITVTRTSMYRNGEQVFATMADLFREAGMEGWYDAFSLIDRSLPKGVLEFEIIEGSYIFDMGAPVFRASPGVPWMLNHSTVGAGTSSVEISVQDNANAVYIISDTTLPSVRMISIEDRDLGLDLTVHFQNGGVKNKSAFYNKYFLVGAVAQNPDMAAPTPIGPAITNFQVHYGSPSGYDAETMGLYSLSFYRQAWYCDEDADCPNYPSELCYDHACNNVECRDDSDCNIISASAQYCVDSRCSYCRDDSDCTGDTSVCRETETGSRKCGSEFCIYDSECPAGQYCDITVARCRPGVLSGPRSSGLLPISEIANREVALREPTPAGDAILKGRWVPVPKQSNDATQRTITVTPFIQGDRTSFIEDFFGDIIPEEYRIYGEVYGLFATRAPGTEDDGEPATYACQQDADCGECEFCSIDNNQCLPKEAAQCGVPDRECREGYTCEQCSCVAPECTSDSQCVDGYKCLDYSCVEEKPPEEKPPEEKPTEEAPAEPVIPPVEEDTPEPEQEKPTYPLVEVEVPSVQAPKQPLSGVQAEFQATQIGLIVLLLIGLVAAYWWFAGKKKKGK